MTAPSASFVLTLGGLAVANPGRWSATTIEAAKLWEDRLPVAHLSAQLDTIESLSELLATRALECVARIEAEEKIDGVDIDVSCRDIRRALAEILHAVTASVCDDLGVTCEPEDALRTASIQSTMILDELRLLEDRAWAENHVKVCSKRRFTKAGPATSAGATVPQ